MNKLVALLAALLAAPALAQTAAGADPMAPTSPRITVPPTGAPAQPAYGKAEGLIPGMVIGPKLSLITVPSPGFGLEMKVKNVFGLSFDKDLFPDVGVMGVEVSYTDWNLGAKWFPWEGRFYVGANYGRRTFEAEAKDSTSQLAVAAKVTTSYLAPQVGWRFVWESGFFTAIDLGYQLVLDSETSLKIPSLGFDTSELADEEKDVKDAADDLGKVGFPVVSLLQIGWFF